MSEIRRRIERSQEERLSESEESVRRVHRSVTALPKSIHVTIDPNHKHIKPKHVESKHQYNKTNKTNKVVAPPTRTLTTRIRIDSDDHSASRSEQDAGSSEVSFDAMPANDRKQTEQSVHSDEQIKQLLVGYILVAPSLYDYIPVGAHIRYFRKEPDVIAKSNSQFKLGGFVREHYMSKGRPCLVLETVPGSCVSCKQEPAYKLGGNVSYPIAYDEIAELWKKYDQAAFIEIHLISASLMREKKLVRQLEERIRKLEMAPRG